MDYFSIRKFSEMFSSSHFLNVFEQTREQI